MHGYQLAGLYEFDLPSVNFLTKRVDDRSFGIFWLERGHDLAHGSRQVDCDRGVQPTRVLQANVGVQHPKIRAGSRFVKRPMQLKRKREASEGHIDPLVPRSASLRLS